MRYRSELGTFATGQHIVFGENGVVTKNENITFPHRSFTRTCEDEVVPNFHKRQNAGEIFNNPFNSGYSTFSSVGNYETFSKRKSDGKLMGNHNWKNGSLFAYLYATGSLNFPLVNLDTANAVKSAQIRAIGAVNKTVFDAGTFAGEWYKTKRLHRDVGNALIKVFEEKAGFVTRKRRFKRTTVFDGNGNPVIVDGKVIYRYIRQSDITSLPLASRRTKELGNAYLVGRYGVAPLLYDLDNARKFLTHLFEDRHTARASEFIQDQKTTVQLLSEHSVAWSMNLTTTKTWQYSPGILYVPSPVMSAVAQLGLTRPLSTAWELVPYSFVVDWFWQVGAWLDALQPSAAAKVRCAWESTHQTTVYSASVSGSLTSSSDPVENWTANWSAGMIHEIRNNIRLPWIPTVPSSPAFGSGFSNPLRSLDIAALVLQKFRMHNFSKINHV